MMPKKGSRRLEVDGVCYRWRESHGHHHFELRLEWWHGRGQMLLVLFPYRHLDAAAPWKVFRPIITRRLLEGVVAFARRLAWQPTLRRPLLMIGSEQSSTLVRDTDYRYSKDLVEKGGRYL